MTATLKTRQFIALSVVFLLSLLSAVITEIYYLVLVPFVVLVFYAGWNNPRIIFLTLLFSLPFFIRIQFHTHTGYRYSRRRINAAHEPRSFFFVDL